ncbi:photosystem reaction center subunit H [Subtercola boreus]|uniref:Photosystem reaction center subunit H n=1 Tax=Subtercola boreus TaxID=120213 RepID=A0A3E0W602_9MICO|nr:PRC and DUF2382 domain-containing protein [Subtercola boreus]RFA16888.1 photosystem reaction center subunit H [Subtercola boreus]
MIDNSNLGALQGAKVLSTDGDKIGTVGQVYLDGTDNHPTWVTVSTGLFGTSESFIPIDRAEFDGENLTVPYEKSFVKDAPRVENDGTLGADDEEQLYRYYGTGGTGYVNTRPDGNNDETSAGHDTSGPNTDDAMTRSEEQLHVGTEKVEAGRARLRKYVTTEQQTVSVPVSHEEVRLEREPITDANAGDAFDGPAISEEEHEVILTEERPVVEKEAVPVERVRLDTETVTENQQVTEDVRKEQIELDGDATRTTDRDTRDTI